MTPEHAFEILSDYYSDNINPNRYVTEAWQTLKAAVLAQQTNNKQSDEITPSCIECANFYACVQKPAKTNGCFSKSA